MNRMNRVRVMLSALALILGLAPNAYGLRRGDGGGNAGDLVYQCFTTVLQTVVDEVETINPHGLDPAKVRGFLLADDLVVDIHEDSAEHVRNPLPPLSWRGQPVDMINRFPDEKKITLSRTRWDLYCKQGRYNELRSIMYHELQPAFSAPDPQYKNTRIRERSQKIQVQRPNLGEGQSFIEIQDVCQVGSVSGQLVLGAEQQHYLEPPKLDTGKPLVCIELMKKQAASECVALYGKSIRSGRYAVHEGGVFVEPRCLGSCVKQNYAVTAICE